MSWGEWSTSGGSELKNNMASGTDRLFVSRMEFHASVKWEKKMEVKST